MSKNIAFTSAQALYDHAINEIKRGSFDRNSHFKWPVLSTLSSAGPECRTVVLRDFNIYDHKVRFYSDSRAKKIDQLNADPRCQLLFFSPRSLTQIRAVGKAFFLEDQIEKHRLWKTIPFKSQKDYTSFQPPGATITSPDISSHNSSAPSDDTPFDKAESPSLSNENKDTSSVWFSVIDIHIESYDILKLNRPDHLRVEATRKENFNPVFKVP